MSIVRDAPLLFLSKYGLQAEFPVLEIKRLIALLPKAELHLHIEGTLEPELMWQLAAKHNIDLPYKSVEDIKSAYQFTDLQSFLDLYYQGAKVLRDEDDFYALMKSYLTHCVTDNVVHTEIMFDPQTHTQRGIGFDVFMAGFTRAINEMTKEHGLSVCLIMSFLRHLSEAEAFDTLAQAKPYYDLISAIGLDSGELGNPPDKFSRVFSQVRELGFHVVAHAGEEGPSEYIWQAIRDLQVERIDHGVKCTEDETLMEYLRDNQLPLTVCPLSNVKLCVVESLSQHNIKTLLDAGLCVTVNSDDPSYFGGYLNDNFNQLVDCLDLSQGEVVTLVKNSFRASFLPEADKQQWVEMITSLADAV